MILAKFSTDWADEFHTEGFALFTNKEWANYLKKLEQIAFPQDLSFGTNEGFDFDNMTDYLSKFDITAIDDHTAITISQVFDISINDSLNKYGQYSSFGICPFYDDDLEEYSEPHEQW